MAGASVDWAEEEAEDGADDPLVDGNSERATLLGGVVQPGTGGSAAGRSLSQRRPGSWWGAVMGSHADAFALFCSPQYRVPMSVVWFTALGGAMHEPAVPYFYLSLGLSAAQIGQAGGIMTAGSLLLAPVYGWIFDKKSALLALVLGISMCGGGCLLRALAVGPQTVLLSALVMSVDGSFESLVLAYVARDQPVTASGGFHVGRLTKGGVISAFLVQAQLTRMAGRALYPAWNWAVRRLFLMEGSAALQPGAPGAKPGVGVGVSQLLRYRIVLASCVVPCVVGFVALLWLCCGPSGRVEARVVAGMARPAAIKLDANPSSKAAAATGSPTKQRASTLTCIAVALVVALMAQGAVSALTYTLWPLFLRVHFDVDDDGFAPLLLVSSVSSATAVLLASTVQARVRGGALSVAAVAAGCAGLATPAAFAVQCPRGISSSALPWHTVLILISVTAVAVLDTSLKSAASELAPRSWQGSAFGVAASLSGIGSVTANVFGTMLYEHSLAEHSNLGQDVAHGVLEHGHTLSNGTAYMTADTWSCGAEGEGWAMAAERVAAGLGGLLPFHVVGALLLVAASGLLIAR